GKGTNDEGHPKEGDRSDDEAHDRDTQRVARSAARAAQGGEGANAAQRRAGAAAAGAAVGSDRQEVSIRDRRGERLAGRPLQRALAAPHLSLHVRARVHGRVSVLLSDRGRVRRLCRPPGQPRRHAFSGIAGASREAASVQAADGVDVSVGVLVRQRLQLPLQRLGHRGATARGGRRIQLPARRPRAGREAGSRRRGACRLRGHDRNRRGHVHAREAGHERVRAGGRRRLPHLFHLRAGTGRPLGHVPVARPRPQRAQRDGPLVAPPRRVQQGLSEVVVVVAQPRDWRSPRMSSDVASQQAFFGVSALLFAASAAGTIVWCASMSAMGEMPMSGGWTMSMAWMRMPGQTWPGAAASFLCMWVVMMVAMMLPSLVPMLWRYRQAVGRRGETRLGRLTAIVGVGYFFVWTVVGMAAFPLGVALAALEMQQPALARAVPSAVGVVVLIAGSLQLTAWKARHLACCREAPGRGRTLPADAGTAWRYGLRLGLHCSHCCAGLMVILLVIGVMDLRAMAVVAAAITVERLVPAGERVARATGAVVVGAGLLLIARAVGLG